VIETCLAAINSVSSSFSELSERYGQTIIIVLGFSIGIAVMARYRWKTRNQKHVFVEMSEMPK
jgi:hypothetical protein